MSPRVITALLILALHAAPENSSLAYMNAVVEVCANIYSVDADLCHCIVDHESRWNLNARGDEGTSVGLWQWKEESIRYAFDDMEVCWDWTQNGDPRLNVWASTLAACYALNQGWDWWSTQELCEEELRGG